MRRQDQTLIAESKGWKLFERTDLSSSEWRSMRLFLQGKRFMGGKLGARFCLAASAYRGTQTRGCSRSMNRKFTACRTPPR